MQGEGEVEGEGDLACRLVACVVDAATAADVGEHRYPQDGRGGHHSRWLQEDHGVLQLPRRLLPEDLRRAPLIAHVAPLLSKLLPLLSKLLLPLPTLHAASKLLLLAPALVSAEQAAKQAAAATPGPALHAASRRPSKLLALALALHAAALHAASRRPSKLLALALALHAAALHAASRRASKLLASAPPPAPPAAAHCELRKEI